MPLLCNFIHVFTCFVLELIIHGSSNTNIALQCFPKAHCVCSNNALPGMHICASFICLFMKGAWTSDKYNLKLTYYYHLPGTGAFFLSIILIPKSLWQAILEWILIALFENFNTNKPVYST